MEPSAADRWAASGAMWLTGRPAGPPRPAPAAVSTRLVAAADTFEAATRTAGRVVIVDGPALLGERAALAGFQRAGDVSCGGATRLLRAADGWLAVALARPDDVELLPAWLGVDPADEPWPAVTAALAVRPAGDAVAAGAELGLAVARLGERRAETEPLIATQLGVRPPVPRLDGRRVVDLSSLWAGPLAGQLLAAAGMDVVKVESSRRPDGGRRGVAPFFDLLNAGKASVALDLTAPPDVEVLRRLLRTADVVIESSRPRALRQLGVDVADIAADGRLRVWLSITAHGRSSPHDDRVGFGDDAAVAGGLVVRDRAGPMFCADAVADPATGLLGAVAVVEHLLGGGQWLLDVALARTAARLAGGEVTAPTVPVARPRARPAAGRAAPLGCDTRRIVAELEPVA